MKTQVELSIKPDDINTPGILAVASANHLKINPEEISAVIPLRKSIDARSKKVVFRILADVYTNESPVIEKSVSIISLYPATKKLSLLVVGRAACLLL